MRDFYTYIKISYLIRIQYNVNYILCKHNYYKENANWGNYFLCNTVTAGRILTGSVLINNLCITKKKTANFISVKGGHKIFPW